MNREFNHQYLKIMFLLELYAEDLPTERLTIAFINGLLNNSSGAIESGQIYFKKYMSLGFMIRSGLVIKLIKDGHTPEEVSSKLDISSSKVYKQCQKHGINLGRKKGFKHRLKMRVVDIDRELVRMMRSDGISFTDISNQLGISRKWAQDMLR
ncbi:hypothetical protein [Vibrio sp. M260112]|uniref:hypothetical protein n=1 Tax=Vibrio sp. M260112 TaxID=3020895 RepID=UPI002F406463